MRRPTLLPLFLALFLAVLCQVSTVHAVTKVLKEGELLLCTDSDRQTYGAVKILDVRPETRSLVFRWYLLPPNQVNLSMPGISSGTTEVTQVQGRAVIAFGPFVLEWHGSGEEKGILSANGTLGVNPVLVASSGIPDVTRIADARSGFAYEVASPRETPDPLGLQESFSNLPQARIGVGVSQTFADIGMGAEEPVVEISRIDEGSNAFKAGLRKGDLILFFNGVEVLTADDFRKALEGVVPKTPVHVSVMRKQNIEDFTFEAEERISLPAQAPAAPLDPNLSPEQRARAESVEDVRRLMNQSMEALRALHFE
jgi:hypothetical protein